MEHHHKFPHKNSGDLLGTPKDVSLIGGKAETKA